MKQENSQFPGLTFCAARLQLLVDYEDSESSKLDIEGT